MFAVCPVFGMKPMLVQPVLYNGEAILDSVLSVLPSIIKKRILSRWLQSAVFLAA
jgi:hypothetical protein